MKVLFVCSLGMSSEIAVQALLAEAQKQGIEMEVKAVSTQDFEEEVKRGYDCSLIAPQIKHRYKLLSGQSLEAGVPTALIEPMAYTPLGGPKLLKQVLALVEEKEI